MPIYIMDQKTALFGLGCGLVSIDTEFIRNRVRVHRN
jgi:hypothetical protein